MSIIRQGLLSADLDVPVVLPTLNLDFANSQSLDKRITFSRGSIGTRVNRNGLIETIAANQPRFDYDPVTGECKGLLIEESRSNLFFYSEQYNQSSWTNQSSTETANTTGTLSPDQFYTAEKLIGDNGQANRQSIYQTVSVTSGTTYTFSVFLKQAERRYATIWFDNVSITEAAFYGSTNYIDLQTGTIANSKTRTKIVAYPNGWYRCYVTATPSFTGSLNLNTSIGTPNNAADGAGTIVYQYTGDGTSGIYLWGAQVEAGAFPTSYIPTTASTVTRSADNASITGTNFSSWYNQTEGSIYCSFKTDGISGGPRTFQLIGNNQNERLDHRLVTNTNGSEYYTGGINFGRISDSGVTNPSQGKITVSQNSRSRQFCMNGRTVLSATIPNAPAVNTLNIGNFNLQATYLNGTIRKLSFYPKALSPAELQYLTQ